MVARWKSIKVSFKFCSDKHSRQAGFPRPCTRSHPNSPGFPLHNSGAFFHLCLKFFDTLSLVSLLKLLNFVNHLIFSWSNFAQVTPLVKEAELEALAPKERHCLYRHEAGVAETTDVFAEITQDFNSSVSFALNQTMFKTYSQTGCFHECKMVGTQLVDYYLTNIDCVPWDHPPLKLGAKRSGNSKDFTELAQHWHVQFWS